MRLFALRDEANDEAGVLAHLEYYASQPAFFFEISPAADPWDLPFILHEHRKRDLLTIGMKWSLAWVNSRIVPPERQNIGEVLRVYSLEHYDEARLLELSEGRCSQDACYLKPIAKDELPAWYLERRTHRLSDACALSGFRIAAGKARAREGVLPQHALPT